MVSKPQIRFRGNAIPPQAGISDGVLKQYLFAPEKGF